MNSIFASWIRSLEENKILAIIYWVFVTAVFFNSLRLLFVVGITGFDKFITLAACIILLNVYRVRFLMYKGKL